MFAISHIFFQIWQRFKISCAQTDRQTERQRDTDDHNTFLNIVDRGNNVLLRVQHRYDTANYWAEMGGRVTEWKLLLTCIACMSFSSLRFCVASDELALDRSPTRSDASCNSFSAALRALSAASSCVLSSSISPASTIARRSDDAYCSLASPAVCCSASTAYSNTTSSHLLHHHV